LTKPGVRPAHKLTDGRIEADTAKKEILFINYLMLTFVADKPPPPHLAYQEVLMAA